MTRTLLATLLALAAGTSLGTRAQAALTPEDVTGTSNAIAIIVNRANPVEGLTFAELRRILLIDTQTWPHGRKITVVLREKGQKEREEILKLVCGMSETDYDRHILFQTFHGSIGWGPRSIRSAGAMLRFVFNAPGAIGYVDAGQVDASVKVLRIDGRLPSDPDYPLRLPRQEP